MARPPFLARLAAGAAVYAVEETRKLPAALIKLPMTALSQTAQNAMHLQQFITSLAIKGDAALSRWIEQPVEQPEWATFDEDTTAVADDPAPDRRPPAERGGNAGRFALYSMPPGPSGDAAAGPVGDASLPNDGVAEPAVAQDLDYRSLTLAQLRARLTGLAATELAELLAYEEETRARAPFITLLSNRIVAAKVK